MRSMLKLLLALPAVLALPSIEKRQSASSVPGSWLVELEQGTDLEAVLRQVQTEAGIEAKETFSIASFTGFSFDGDDSQVDALSAIESLRRVEPDVVFETSAPVGELEKRALVTQAGSTWGLARISSRQRGTSGYVYDDSAGQGTFVYVLDTGVNTGHNDFGGRAISGSNFITREGPGDGHGHGTHCAGTVGGNVFGVAKRTTLIGVKVLGSDGRGTAASTLNGLDWAVNDARRRGVSRSVISMSLGGPFSRITNDAVAAAVRAGVFVAVAAGNDNANAGNFSPASEPLACTVGATDINDNRSTFSNFGTSVNVFAPGTNVQSTWIGSNSATRTISGTSMACPHVAGLAAYLIALEGPQSPQALCRRITGLATSNVIAGVNGSPNLLAYNGNNRR